MDCIWTMDKSRLVFIDFMYFCAMKTLPVIIAILICCLACRRQQVIAPIFPWPESGVAEADSILLQIERERVSLDRNPLNRINLKNQFCSIARLYPNNHLLQSRDAYLKACDVSSCKEDLYLTCIDSAFLFVDSIKNPYDWHMLSTIKVEGEHNVVARYHRIMDNIRFFQSVNSLNQLGINYNYLGNLLIDLRDSVKAREYYQKAETIYSDLKFFPQLLIVKLNIARTYPDAAHDSILNWLRHDRDAKKFNYLQVLTLQNSFILNSDSIQFLEKAHELYQADSTLDQRSHSMVLGLMSHYYTLHGEPDKALRYIEEAFDSTYNVRTSTHFMQGLWKFKGLAHLLYGNPDSAAASFSQSIFWQDSLMRELNHSGIYRLEVLNQIKIEKQEGQIKRYKLILLFGGSILILSIAFLIMVMRIRSLKSKKKIEELKHAKLREESNRALRAQMMVIEENKRLIEDITSRLNLLKDKKEIDMVSADKISNMLKIHKSNEDNRNGFLKMQQELDINFQSRLLHDYPLLSDGQLKLASLIACGLDTRQICSILSIEPTSVHKGRYRLRMRLNITGDQNLEEFLRSYNKS